MILILSHQEILKSRHDVKIVIMCASLDAGKFQNYFEGCPLLVVKNTLFPVEIYVSFCCLLSDEFDLCSTLPSRRRTT